MRARVVGIGVVAASWTLFVLAFLWPGLAIIGACLARMEPPESGFAALPRQLGLLGRTFGLSAAATGVSVLVSLPAAYTVGRVRRLSHLPWFAMLLMVLLLSPPMVCAFGWERILPPDFSAPARCIAVWALWLWPIPAMLIGAGWSRAGRSAHEAAMLSGGPGTVFLRITVPLLARYLALSALIVFVLCFGDYSVPHACGLVVYATEVLGAAQASSQPIDVVWLSVPPVVVIAVALATILWVWRRCPFDEDVGAGALRRLHPSKGLVVTALAGFSISWLLPIGALVVDLASTGAMVRAWTIYSADLAWSVGLGVLSGFLVVVMGLGMVAAPRLRAVFLVGTVLFGALPGALIGSCLIAAYNHNATWWVYDSWPIVAVSYVSRFGWVGVLTAELVARGAGSDMVGQAQTDGADRASMLWHVHFGMHGPTLLCGAGVVAALSVAEVAASEMVRVPSFSPIAHVLMEKFHRFEYDMLVSLSLWLVAAVLFPAGLLALTLRRRSYGRD